MTTASTASFRAWHFADATHGWAVGEKGTILASSPACTLPTRRAAGRSERRAATLVTTNGGATWQKRDSGGSCLPSDRPAVRRVGEAANTAVALLPGRAAVAVARIVPFSPTAQPRVASAKCTPTGRCIRRCRASARSRRRPWWRGSCRLSPTAQPCVASAKCTPQRWLLTSAVALARSRRRPWWPGSCRPLQPPSRASRRQTARR